MRLPLLRSWSRHFCTLACWLAVALANSAVAGKPQPPDFYSDVRITFAGETFGLAGTQASFSISQDGGRVVFDLMNTIGTSDYLPVPEIDTETLPQGGNHWEVVAKLGRQSYVFVGICASETFSSTDATATVVRHIFLNCRDMSSYYVP
jgi:hypothetical protein